jgi:hypothetical protein
MDFEASSYVVPRIPSALAGTLPRKVQMSEGVGAGYLLLVVLLFFVGGSVILGWNCYYDVKQFQQTAVLRSSGREVVGEVTGFSFGRYTPMTVNYRFTVGGVIYSGEATESTTHGPGTSLNKSDQILVRFLPSNPAINHPRAWEWSPRIELYFTAGEAFLWAMGGLAFAVLWRDRKLARKGKAAAGIVTGCMRKASSFQVEYEFRAEDNVLMKGHSECGDEYGAGARIWILYLPQKPQRNHIYPLSFYSVVE